VLYLLLTRFQYLQCAKRIFVKILLCFLQFFRCENPSQRLLGINMMCGLLRTRERAVSLEAYSTVITPSLHKTPAQLLERVAEWTNMMNSDDVTKTDYSRLQLAFSSVLNHTVVTIAQSISEVLGKSPEERSLLMLQWVRKLSEREEAARLRYCLMLCHPTHHTPSVTCSIMLRHSPSITDLIILNHIASYHA
jgi:hypothetical protein